VRLSAVRTEFLRRTALFSSSRKFSRKTTWF
jgi:hypothetical protein